VNDESDRPSVESVVLVPAPDVGQVVRDLRMQHDPSAAAGVPPHVTLMFPFVPPRDLTEPTFDTLEQLITGTRAFQFSLTRVNEFEQGVVYLEPEPAEPFVQLTRELSRRFGILPFGGDFGEEPVPHLTVAILESASTRERLVNQLSSLVPIVIRADEAWLMVGNNATRWNVVRQMRFHD
jgi:2'-5' RNA ligase